MKKVQENPKKQKIFKKLDSPHFLSSFQPLYQISFLQLSKHDKNTLKQWYFRVYDEFMLISNVIYIYILKKFQFFIESDIFQYQNS